MTDSNPMTDSEVSLRERTASSVIAPISQPLLRLATSYVNLLSDDHDLLVTGRDRVAVHPFDMESGREVGHAEYALKETMRLFLFGPWVLLTIITALGVSQSEFSYLLLAAWILFSLLFWASTLGLETPELEPYGGDHSE